MATTAAVYMLLGQDARRQVSCLPTKNGVPVVDADVTWSSSNSSVVLLQFQRGTDARQRPLYSPPATAVGGAITTMFLVPVAVGTADVTVNTGTGSDTIPVTVVSTTPDASNARV